MPTTMSQHKVLTGKLTFSSLKPCDLSACTKREIEDYFDNTYDIYESLFTSLKDDSVFYKCPDRLRLPLIFYFGHTAAVYVNKLVLAQLIQPDERVRFEFETLFETGVDEMSWDDTENFRLGPKFNWPKVDDVVEYRRKVRHLIHSVIEKCELKLPISFDSPLWSLFMGMEHERIHLETSSVLIRQLPVDLVKKPPTWIYGPIDSGKCYSPLDNPMIVVQGTNVTLGKPLDFPSYGWDNEYGLTTMTVPTFEAAKFPTTNAQFLEFVQAGGYHTRRYWTDEGWNWVQFRQAKHPTFWVCDEGCKSGCGGTLSEYSHCKPSCQSHVSNGSCDGDTKQYRYRRMFDVTDMPWSWPVDVNYHEAKAYCAWKGPEYRLLSEAEHQLIHGPMPDPSVGVESDMIYSDNGNANINLQYGSSTPVDFYDANILGFHDVTGNVWQWLEDHFNGFPGFKTSYFYDDFSTPCFDGRHTMIGGGSWVSTGDEASRFARFAFRRHFFQHLGFRIVRNLPSATNKVLPLPIRLVSTPVFVLGAGIQEIEPPVDPKKYSCIELSSTNSQYCGETDDSLAASLQAEYHLNGSSLATRVLSHCKQLIEAHLPDSNRQRALHIGCATGKITLDLGLLFRQVIGQDTYGRFIDAAIRLKNGEQLKYTTSTSDNDSKTQIVVAADRTNVTNVVFKQFTWLPNELEHFDFILCTQLHRLQSQRAWLVRLNEILKDGGLLVIVDDNTAPMTVNVGQYFKRRLRMLADSEHKPLHIRAWTANDKSAADVVS